MSASLGKFVRVKKGVVCFRDADGNFTDQTVDLFAEVPKTHINAESGLTHGEENTASIAVNNIFAPLAFESDAIKKYINGCKTAGIKI